MFQAFIHRFLLHRHFWRYANFDEIGELYASRMMRLLAVFMINVFVALYLYQQGYSLLFIASFYALSFLFRAGVTYFAARFVAKFGPKHGILTANLLYIPALIAFPFLATFGLPAIIIFGLFQSLSMVTFDLAYLVDFSKVKHVEHAGKEIGYMQILERLTASLSPLIGGTIAFLIAPEATIWFSAVLFVFASLPLFRTKEQVRLNQKLDFRHFPWRDTWQSIRAETAIGFDAVASNFVWVLFIAVTIFGVSSGDDSVYFLVGAFASITILTSFFSAYAFGRIIDRRHGGDLLNIAAIANAMTHVFRAFVTTPAGIVAANVGNEVATTGYSMAFMRGIFDTADNAKGHRIVYLMLMSAAANVGGFIGSLVFVLILLMNLPLVLSFQMFFVVAAVYVLLAMTARFRLYR
jgi:MFS family permease